MRPTRLARGVAFGMLLALVLASHGAAAQEPVKIGLITTLSTEAGYLGEEVRNGFQLAVDQGHGRLGTVPVELVVEDDGREPGNARRAATRMMEQEGVRLMTGIVFSDVALAVVPEVLEEGGVYVSANAGPSDLAGQDCHPGYFNVAWQNDNLNEAMGQHLTDQGYDRVYLLAPDYPAGKDALAGFKRFYQGGIAGEVYTQLGQTDYSGEIAGLRAAEPDAVFFFLPDGMGADFTRQYAQAGLAEEIPLFGPAFSFDNTLVDSVGEAAVGVRNTAQWSGDLDNPVNQRFVREYTAEYGREPTVYASQGYDAAQLIGSALAAVNGNLDDRHLFVDTLRKASFMSVRGDFRFALNRHPIQDIYLREVVEDEDGNLSNRIVTRVFEDHQDAYVDDCPHR